MSGTTRFWFATALALAIGCGDDDGGDDPGDGSEVDAGASDATSGDGGAAPNIDRAQAGGAPSAIDIGDGAAFVGVGPRLAVWRNVGDGEGPRVVAETDPFEGVVTGVVSVGDRVFVGERREPDGRIHVFDVSDPGAPVETASFALVAESFSWPRGMTGVDQRLFIADQEQGVIEVDVSDPDAPSVVGIIAPIPGVVDVEVVGERLYYMVESFVGSGVGAVSLVGEPVDLGFVPLFGANGMAVAQDLVVAAGSGGIQVHDVSDLASPVERFRLELPDGGPFSRAVAVTGAQAWIPAEDGLYVLDLTTPTAITIDGPFALPIQGANAAAARPGLVAVVTDRGRLIGIDVADPAEPVLRAGADVTLCSDCSGIAVAGDVLVAADFTGGLRTARVDDLGLAGRSTEPAEMVVFEDVALAGDRAYVADWAFGLRIYDVSDPGAPALVDVVDTAGFPSSVAVAGSRVYVGEGTNGGALRVIDVESDPVEIASVATSKARDVEVRDGLAYVADEELDTLGGLRIFDVSAPPELTPVGSYQNPTCTSALDVALSGSIAVLACASGGFHVVDISNPASPQQLSVVSAPDLSSAWSVAAWEGGAALGHDYGVLVVDLTDPVAPVEVASHPTPYVARALSVPGDGRLIASCALGGMYQWALPEPE